jgi:hypothetical protein
MICVSLNKNINCDYICKLISDYISKNIKSQDQAANTILKISFVEIKSDSCVENVILNLEKKDL